MSYQILRDERSDFDGGLMEGEVYYITAILYSNTISMGACQQTNNCNSHVYHYHTDPPVATTATGDERTLPNNSPLHLTKQLPCAFYLKTECDKNIEKLRLCFDLRMRILVFRY